jgi:type 1 fimbria pilin
MEEVMEMLANIFRNGCASLVLLALAVYGGPVMANGCGVVIPGFKDVVAYSGAPISVKSSANVGDTLFTYSGQGNGALILAGCFGGTTTTFTGSSGVFATPAGIPGVYATNLSGIGIRVTVTAPETNDTQQTVPYSVAVAHPGPGQINYSDTGRYTVELVRTAGALAAGQVNGGNIAVFDYSPNPTGQIYRVISLDQGTFTIQAPTCSVTADSINQTVDLGNWNLRKFAAIGDGSDPKTFKIVSSGCDTSYTAVHFTFNAAADTNNADYFAAGGTVSGIGLDLQAINGTPTQVRPGKAVTFAPQYAVGSSYDFTARMVRTGNVVAGTVRAPVQVNVSYD